MCMIHSKSGQTCGFTPCEEYKHLDDVYRRVMANSTTLHDERDALLEKVKQLSSDVQKHKDRRQCFEDLLNRSIEHEQEWTQRAIKAEAENVALRQELANLKSGHDVRESIEELEDMDHLELVGAYMAMNGLFVAADHENQKLRQERDEAVKLLRECLPFVESIEGEDCGERADAFLDKLGGSCG